MVVRLISFIWCNRLTTAVKKEFLWWKLLSFLLGRIYKMSQWLVYAISVIYIYMYVKCNIYRSFIFRLRRVIPNNATVFLPGNFKCLHLVRFRQCSPDLFLQKEAQEASHKNQIISICYRLAFRALLIVCIIPSANLWLMLFTFRGIFWKIYKWTINLPSGTFDDYASSIFTLYTNNNPRKMLQPFFSWMVKNIQWKLRMSIRWWMYAFPG